MISYGVTTKYMADAKFIDGMFYERPREGAPDFVKGKISLNVERLIPFLESVKNEKGYVNIDLKESREGKYYAELNTWTPEGAGNAAPAAPAAPSTDEIDVSKVPF